MSIVYEKAKPFVGQAAGSPDTGNTAKLSATAEVPSNYNKTIPGCVTNAFNTKTDKEVEEKNRAEQINGISKTNAAYVHDFYEARSYCNKASSNVTSDNMMKIPKAIPRTEDPTLNAQADIDTLETKLPGIKQFYIDKAKSNLKALREEGAYDLLDPLVGDWSCQLRAANFARFFMTHPTLDNLSELDMLYIGASIFLTESQKRTRDALGISVLQKTDETQFPKKIAAESRQNKDTLFGLTKCFVARKTLSDLRSWVQSSQILFQETVLKQLNDNVSFLFSCQEIPFLNFFAGYYLFTEMVKSNQIPITVILTQFMSDDKNDKLKLKINGKQSILYLYNPQDKKFTPQVESDDLSKKLTIVIDMYSVQAGTPVSPAPGITFYKATDFNEFINLFKKEMDIEELILGIAATHPQFPNNCQQAKKTIGSMAYKDRLTPMYARCRQAAEKNSVGVKKYTAAEKPQTTVTINTQHVYLSTLNREKGKLKN